MSTLHCFFRSTKSRKDSFTFVGAGCTCACGIKGDEGEDGDKDEVGRTWLADSSAGVNDGSGGGGPATGKGSMGAVERGDEAHEGDGDG